MGTTYKVLGQQNPAAATPTALYTVPASTSAVCSSLIVTNRDTVPHSYRIWVAVAGAGTDNKQYLAYDVQLAANTFVTMTLGITLATTDVVKVYVDAQQVSFNLFGAEIT